MSAESVERTTVLYERVLERFNASE
jgi:hypothetical protein